MKSRVAIAHVASVDSNQAVEAAVREAVTLSCDFEGLVRGKKVVLKPNVYCPLPPPTTTDPRVISALIKVAREAGAAKITVAEGRSVSTAKFRKGSQTTKACFAATGMDKAAALADEVVYLEDDEFLTVDVPGAVKLAKATVPRTILEAEVLINVPVLKNHSLTLITLGIKNLHGVVSDENKLFGHDYDSINVKLVDILRLVKPALTVIDGVRGQEADHADVGRPVDFKAIFAGTDTVAVDAVACHAIGLDPLEVDLTRIAHGQGVGTADISRIEVVGAAIDDVKRPFARPDIEISEDRFPGIKLYTGEYCQGCEYYIRRGIDRLVEQGVLDPEDRLTLVFGKDPVLPDDIPGRVVICGDCALESRSVKHLRNKLFLEGRLKIVYACPPMEFRMRALELAGD